MDKGLAAEQDGAQVMKPIAGLDQLLARAVDNGIFGTKMRSVIKLPGAGLDAVVAQQFEVARQILAAGLVPIIEPEVDIHSPARRGRRPAQGRDHHPSRRARRRPASDAQADAARHRRPLPRPRRRPQGDAGARTPGGYTRAEACERLARNHGVIASFSRALTEGLTAQQSDAEFDKTLDSAIAEIAAASRT